MNKVYLLALAMLAGCAFSAQAQTNPLPHSIKAGAFAFKGFDDPTQTTYPLSMAGWRGPLQTQSPTASTTVQATADEVLCTTCSGTDVVSISNEGALGISIRTSNNATTTIAFPPAPDTTKAPLAIVVALNTLDAYSVKVSWRGGLLVTDPSVNDLSLQALTLQYRVGITGAWTNVTNSAYREADFGLQLTEGAYTATLPAAANNQAEVQLRWLAHTINENKVTDRLILNTIYAAADSLVGVPKTGYCDARGAIGCPSTSAYITNAGSLLGTSNTSDCGTDSLGYSNFTGLGPLLDIATGDALDLYVAVTQPSSLFLNTVQVAAYIDWNQDLDFNDVGEMLVLTGTTFEFLGTITVPADAKSGLTRLRFRAMDLTETMSPCGVSGSGEVEDYLIRITNILAPAPACLDTAQFKPRSEATQVCENTTFSWPQSATASKYKFYLFKDDQTNLVSYDTVLNATAIAKKLDLNQVYVWRVVPFNDSGEASVCDTLFFTTGSVNDPSLTLTNPADSLEVCNNIDLLLETNLANGTAPFSYKWIGQDLAYLSDTLSATSTFKSTSNVSTLNKYFVSVSDANGCKSLDSLVISTLAAPDTAILNASNLSFCRGDSSILSVNSIAMYTLQDSNSVHTWQPVFLNTVGQDSVSTSAISTTTSYRAVTTNGSCNSISNVIEIVVNQLPSLPLISGFPFTEFCSGDSTFLTCSNYVGGLVWNEGTVNDTLIAKQSGFYFVKYTDSFGCSNVSAQLEIIAHSLPTAPIISSSSTQACDGDSIILFATGTSISWNDDLQTLGSSLIRYESGTFIAQTTDSNNCVNFSEPISLVFNANPVKPIISVEGGVVSCSNSPTVLISSYTFGNLWNDSLITLTDSLIVLNSGSYQVIHTDVNGCIASSDSIAITINASPVKATITQVGDTIIAPSYGTGFIYTWFNAAGDTIKSGADSILVSPLGAVEYFLVVTSPAGCNADASEKVRFSSTGIKQFNTASLRVQPNPSKGFVSIQNPLNEKVTLVVYDLSGKQVAQFDLESGINTQQLNLAGGTYLLCVIAKETIYRSTLLILE